MASPVAVIMQYAHPDALGRSQRKADPERVGRGHEEGAEQEAHEVADQVAPGLVADLVMRAVGAAIQFGFAPSVVSGLRFRMRRTFGLRVFFRRVDTSRGSASHALAP